MVATAAVVLVLAVPALAASNVRTWWEKQAKEAALEQKDEAFRQRETALAESRAKGHRAAVEAQTAGAISDFLQEMLASANPDRSKGTTYTVRELLDDVSKRMDDQLPGQPEVEATVRRTIGVAYRRLGLSEKAEPHLKRRLELRRRIFGGKHEKVAESLIDYAWNLAAAGRHAAAEECVREALRSTVSSGEPPLLMIQALWALAVAPGVSGQARRVGGRGPRGAGDRPRNRTRRVPRGREYPAHARRLAERPISSQHLLDQAGGEQALLDLQRLGAGTSWLGAGTSWRTRARRPSGWITNGCFTGGDDAHPIADRDAVVARDLVRQAQEHPFLAAGCRCQAQWRRCRRRAGRDRARQRR